MLAEKHDIDQLFRDRLEGHEEHPPMYVWKNIEDALDKRKKAYWLALIKGASIAAAVVLAFIAGWMVTQSHQEQATKEVVVVPQKSVDTNQQPTNVSVKTATPDMSHAVAPVKVAALSASVEQVKMTGGPGTGNSNTVQINEAAVLAMAERRQDETMSEINARIPSVPSGSSSKLSGQNESWIQFLSKHLGLDNDNDSQLAALKQKLNDQSIIADNIQKYQDEKKNKPINRWKLAAEASPLFSGESSSGGHSAPLYAAANANALSSVSQSSTSTEPTFSGGVMFGYKLNKRLSVKSGIVYSKIRHNTSRVSVFGDNNPQLANVRTDYGVNSNSTAYAANTEVGMVNFRKPPSSIKDGAYLADLANGVSTTAYTSNADLKQNLEYVEIPVLVAYHLIDRKVNVDLTGGMSTNILVGNNASLIEGGVKTQSGETSQLRDLVYAGTVGLGLGYDLSKRITVTLEPRMKYYLNSISKSSQINYRPYQLGIYTGLTYAFN